MGDGVRGHHQLVAVEPGEQVLGHVGVPELLDLLLAVALGLPLCGHCLVDEVNDLDQEGAGAGGGVEDLDEGLFGCGAFGDLEVVDAAGDLAPGGGVGEAVFEAELGAQ